MYTSKFEWLQCVITDNAIPSVEYHIIHKLTVTYNGVSVVHDTIPLCLRNKVNPSKDFHEIFGNSLILGKISKIPLENFVMNIIHCAIGHIINGPMTYNNKRYHLSESSIEDFKLYNRARHMIQITTRVFNDIPELYQLLTLYEQHCDEYHKLNKRTVYYKYVINILTKYVNLGIHCVKQQYGYLLICLERIFDNVCDNDNGDNDTTTYAEYRILMDLLNNMLIHILNVELTDGNDVHSVLGYFGDTSRITPVQMLTKIHRYDNIGSRVIKTLTEFRALNVLRAFDDVLPFKFSTESLAITLAVAINTKYNDDKSLYAAAADIFKTEICMMILMRSQPEHIEYLPHICIECAKKYASMIDCINNTFPEYLTKSTPMMDYAKDIVDSCDERRRRNTIRRNPPQRVPEINNIRNKFEDIVIMNNNLEKCTQYHLMPMRK